MVEKEDAGAGILPQAVGAERPGSGWPARLDRTVAWCGALVPAGVVLGNAAFESLVALAGLVWLIRLAVVRDNPVPAWKRAGILLPWAAWVAAIWLSLFVNGAGSKGWGHDLAFLRFLLFGAALLDVGTRRPLGRIFVQGLAGALVLAAANTVSALVFGADLLGKPAVRYTGKLKEASRIAGLCAYAVPFFVAWAVSDRNQGKRARAWVMFFGVLAFAQVLQTQVRTSILAAIGAVVLAMAVVHRRRMLTGWGLAAVAAFIASALWLFFHFELWNLASFYDRIYYWRVGWYMFLDNPVFGTGISGFQEAYTAWAQSGIAEPFVAPNGRVYQLAELTHLHNLLLMVAVCTGILGLAAFGWLFVRASLKAFNQARGWRHGLATWPFVVLLVGVTGFNIYHSWYQALLAWFLVLIAAPWRESTAAQNPGTTTHA
ncbi:MAG: O-antigen ligase family protein [Desulfatibacillaceae bacterium]